MNPKLIKKKNSKKEIQFEIPIEFFIKGKEMTEAYYNLFIFENYFRSFIEILAKNEFGSKFWKKLIINKKIQEKIDERKLEERSKRWLSIRGDSAIFYTDLIELKTIISSNWDIFKEYFPKEVWIISKLEDLYDLRNKIAHNSYLNNDEQNTLKALITNIYSQLRSKQKFRSFILHRREELESFEYDDDDDYYLEFEEDTEPVVIKIDFKLVKRYLEMLDEDEVPYEDFSDILHSIHNQVWKVSQLEDIKQEDLLNFKNLCEVLLNFMKNKDDYIRRRALDVLEDLIKSNETKEILKDICYEYLVELYKNGSHYTDLIRILDSFDYFKDLENLIVRAIDQEDEGLLHDYYNSLNFSKFKNKRIEIITSLIHKLKEISQDTLKDRVKKIIRRLEDL